MNNLQLDINPEFWHFQYLRLGFSSKFYIKKFIDLLQPYTGTWNGLEFVVEEEAMDEWMMKVQRKKKVTNMKRDGIIRNFLIIFLDFIPPFINPLVSIPRV